MMRQEVPVLWLRQIQASHRHRQDSVAPCIAHLHENLQRTRERSSRAAQNNENHDRFQNVGRLLHTFPACGVGWVCFQ